MRAVEVVNPLLELVGYLTWLLMSPFAIHGTRLATVRGTACERGNVNVVLPGCHVVNVPLGEPLALVTFAQIARLVNFWRRWADFLAPVAMILAACFTCVAAVADWVPGGTEAAIVWTQFVFNIDWRPNLCCIVSGDSSSWLRALQRGFLRG